MAIFPFFSKDVFRLWIYLPETPEDREIPHILYNCICQLSIGNASYFDIKIAEEREIQIAVYRNGRICTFLVSPRKVPKESDLRGHYENACPLKKPLRRISIRCPKMSRFLNTCYLDICRFLPGRLAKIGTFLPVGWRSGGRILKEGAFSRSASLS